MSLTEEQKRKIEEEEKYRAQVRVNHSEKPKKKGMGILMWLLVIFVGIPVLIAIISMSLSGSSTNTNSTSPTPAPEKKELLGTVNFDGELFHVINQEERNWTQCWLTINKDYNFPQDRSAARFNVNAQETYPIDPADVTLEDGTRFNPLLTKPSNVSVSCNEGFGYWTW